MTPIRSYHQGELSPENRRKLHLSRLETSGLSLREIRCPHCDYLVDRVFSDATGHKMEYCKKCKEEYPINLGYFRRMKYKEVYGYFRYKRQHR